MGKFIIRHNVKDVDDRLVNIIRQAAHRSPYDVELFSGKRGGSGSSRHDHGKAVDVVLINPRTGEKVPNLTAGGKAFEAYQAFANEVRTIQRDQHPELDRKLRWGGYFGPSGANPGGIDLMHFDLKPGAPMSQGSWEGGLNSAGKRRVAALGAGRTYSADYKGPGTMPASFLAYEPIAPKPIPRPASLMDFTPKVAQASLAPRPSSAPSRARKSLDSMLGKDEPDNSVNFDVAGYFDRMEADKDRLSRRYKPVPRDNPSNMAPSMRMAAPKPVQQMAPSKPLPISKPQPTTYQVTNRGGAVQRLKGGPDPVLPHNVRPNVPAVPGVAKSIVPPSTSGAYSMIQAYINNPMLGREGAQAPSPTLMAPTPPVPPQGLQQAPVSPVVPIRPTMGMVTRRPSGAISGSTYQIQPGDTLSTIAQRSGRSVSDLARINGISNPNLIMAGATLNLGGGSSSGASGRSSSSSSSRSTSRASSRPTSSRTTNKPTNVFKRNTGRVFDPATNRFVPVGTSY